jgi:hypothetical protein
MYCQLLLRFGLLLILKLQLHGEASSLFTKRHSLPLAVLCYAHSCVHVWVCAGGADAGDAAAALLAGISHPCWRQRGGGGAHLTRGLQVGQGHWRVGWPPLPGQALLACGLAIPPSAAALQATHDCVCHTHFPLELLYHYSSSLPFPSTPSRLDNLVFDSVDPSRVLAVLDWELSTLGDPLADLAYNCMPYHLPAVSPACTSSPSGVQRSSVCPDALCSALLLALCLLLRVACFFMLALLPFPAMPAGHSRPGQPAQPAARGRTG